MIPLAHFNTDQCHSITSRVILIALVLVLLPWNRPHACVHISRRNLVVDLDLSRDDVINFVLLFT
jgi:hypothetical protein